MKIKRPLRLLGIALGGVVLALVVIVALGIFTSIGRHSLVAIGLGIAERAGFPVTIARLDWPALGQLEVEGVSVEDPDGAWLTVDRALLTWRPRELLSGTLAVDVLDVGTVDLVRAPAYPPSPAPPSTQSAPLLPPIALDIGRLSLGELSIPQSLAGEAATVTATASLRVPHELAQGATAHVDASVHGRAPADAAIDLVYKPSDNTLEANVALTAAPGGLIHILAGLPPQDALAVRFNGTGPLAAWSADLAARLGDRDLADGSVTIARQGTLYRLTANLAATAVAAELMPAPIAPVIGPSPTLALAATVADDGAVRIESLAVGTAAGSVTGAGEIAADGALAGRLDATLAASTPFAALTGNAARWNGGRAQVAVSGTRDAPAATITATIDTLATDALTADRLDFDASLTPEAGITGAAGHRVHLTASLPGAAVAGTILPADDVPSLELSAVVDTDGAATIETARIAALSAVVTLSGAAGPEDVDLAAEATVGDLARLGALAGQRLAGAATLRATVSGNPATRQFAAGFDLSATRLSTAIDVVDRLLGPAPTASGSVSIAEDRLTVDGFDLAGSGLTAGAAGVLALDAAGIDVTAAVADLAAIDPTLAGSGTLAARITGDVRHPTVAFDLTAETLRVAGQDFGGIGLKGTADLAASAGAPAGTTRAALDAAVTASGAGPMQIEGKAEIAGAPQRLDVTLGVASAKGGTAQRLAGLYGLTLDQDLAITVAASGPIDDLAADVTASLEGAPVLGAKIATAPLGTGRRITLTGSVAPGFLLPPEARAAAGDSVAVDAAIVLDRGITRIERATVTAAAATLSANGTLDGGGGLAIVADAKLADSAPLADLLKGAAEWTGGTVHAVVGGSTLEPTADFVLALDGLSASEFKAATVTADGRAARRSDGGLDVTVDAGLTGVVVAGNVVPDTPQPKLSATATVAADGVVTIESARLDAFGAGVTAKGSVGPAALDLSTTIAAPDLGPLGAALGRPLSGGVAATAEITGDPRGPALTAVIALQGSALDVGIPQANAALGPAPKVTGTVAYAADSVTVTGLTLEGGAMTVKADGTIAAEAAGLDITATVRDLAALSPNLAGAATITAKVAGKPTAPQVAFRFASDQITTAGQVLRPFAAEGTLDLSTPGAIAAALDLSGAAAGRPISGKIAFADGADGRRLTVDNLAFVGLSGSGSLAQKGIAPPTGNLTLQATDVAPLAALAGVAATGGFRAALDLPEDKSRPAHVTLSSPRLAVLGNTVEALDVALDVTDPLGTPHFAGTARATRIDAAGQRVDRLSVTAEGPLSAVALVATATVNAMTTRVDAVVDAATPRVRVQLSRAEVGTGATSVRLSRPSTVTYADGGVRLDVGLTTGSGGRLDLRGTASATDLGLQGELERLPIGLARIAVPDLAYEGTLGGRFAIRGTPAAPGGTYDISLAGFRDTRWRSQVPSVTANVQGSLNGRTTDVRARVEAGQLMRLTIDGSAPLSPTGPLNLAIRGPIDLDLLEGIALEPTTDISGRLAVDVRVTGTAQQPNASGSVDLGNISVNDHLRGIAANRIRGQIRLAGRTVNLVGITGNFGGGGTLAAAGSVTLDPAAGFPGNLTLTAKQIAVDQGEGLARGIIGADIRMSGPLARAPAIGGTVTIARMDINIAERLPSTAETIDVTHINVPARLAEYFPAPPDPNASRAPAFDAKLDLTVTAASQINVRGLGLNAEFRGSFKISGTTSAPVILGGLDLRRGTFDILNQRLTFDHGTIRFVDDFDPILDLVALTRAGSVTAYVTVSGTGSNPRIEFSSEPTLPQDEVVSYILFRKATSSLTATEAIMLADAVASLSGGGSSGLLDRIRKSLGLNRLGVTGDGAGGTSLEAGGYAAENVYVGVTQGTTAASSQVQVTVDVTDSINLNANVGADGSSSLGLGVEWDY